MNNSHSDSYKAAGVDITAGYKAVDLIKPHVKRTHIPGVLGGVGGFGGMFEPDFSGMERPVLVSGTDGVGTKLKIAFMLDKHDTVGIDCVAMCVNDIVCLGGKPLTFLDYLALGKNVPELVEQIVSGVAEGCVRAGCALVGGETAEMPGLYQEGEYDLAGFATGVVDKAKILDPANASEGDVLIAVASNGLHSNGFSLVRKALGATRESLGARVMELGETLGEALLTPTRIYVKSCLELLSKAPVKAMANITGGGFFENIPRAYADHLRAVIDKTAIRTPPIFDIVKKAGNIDERDMFNTFNMGVGLVVIVSADNADAAVRALNDAGETAYVIGRLEKRADGERLILA